MGSAVESRSVEIYPAGAEASWFGAAVGSDADAVLELSSPPGHAHATQFSIEGNGYGGGEGSSLDLVASRQEEHGLDELRTSSYVLFTCNSVLNEKGTVNTASLGWGVLVFPGRQAVPGPVTLHRAGVRCYNCGAYLNVFCSLTRNAGEWMCTLCKKRNNFDRQYDRLAIGSLRELDTWPELVTSVVDYIETGARSRGLVSVADSVMSAPVVILVDESVHESQLTFLQSSLHYFFNSLPASTRIGIITYGRTVSVYDFSEIGFAVADVVPGAVPPGKELLKMLIYGTGVYLAPVHVCLPIAQAIVSSLRPYQGELPESARDRCMGTAVRVALTLIEGLSTDLHRGAVKRAGGSSRVIVCAGGPNTLGVGGLSGSEDQSTYPYMKRKAIKQMESLGQEARRLDTVVDILAAGTCPLNISAVQPLVKESGGVLILHDDFGDTFGLNLERAVRRATGFRGILEVRCSKEVGVRRIIGPGEEVKPDTGEVYKNDGAVQLVSMEETQGFAMTLELLENSKDDYLYFQFVVRFTNCHLLKVTRVITVRQPTTSSVPKYLQSINDEVLAVLLSKKMVLEAKTPRDAKDIQVSVDNRLKDIAMRFGKQVASNNSSHFPNQIGAVPEFLFHLRRGPMLGSIIGHEDERQVLVNLFLQASFDLALRMMAPRLLMHCEGGTFEELPAYDLALQSDVAIVLDHGNDIFIWQGAEVVKNEPHSAAVLAACRTLAQELSEHRFPAPRILSFKEGSSQARYMQSRMIPAHKDPPYEQEMRFPQLQSLTLEQRKKLSQSFTPTDDLSFFEYMRSLKLVPPPYGRNWASQQTL